MFSSLCLEAFKTYHCNKRGQWGKGAQNNFRFRDTGDHIHYDEYWSAYFSCSLFNFFLIKTQK